MTNTASARTRVFTGSSGSHGEGKSNNRLEITHSRGPLPTLTLDPWPRQRLTWQALGARSSARPR